MLDNWQTVAALTAVVLAFWPQMRDGLTQARAWLARRREAVPAAPVVEDEVEADLADGAGYLTCIYYLDCVRNRLRDTGTYDEPKKAAIDLLTLALGEGSDK